MSYSVALIPQSLMYDTVKDQAFWVPPARSWILLAVNPTLELIEEDDPSYPFLAKMAGPKPKQYFVSRE